MNLADTSFEDAKESFRAFLADNGMRGPILWVFREDVFSRNINLYPREFWLKLPIPRANEEFAKSQFEVGKSRGFGMGLIAFARCDEGLCCSLVVPTDDEDAQYMMLGPEHLKMSYINVDMPTARVVRSRIKWRLFGLLPFWFRSEIDSVDLASRAELSGPELGETGL